MPLQWKKTMMNTRISQLFNDHLHRSQKRRDGSSLLVETGFPTSLVDLFIKNRDKLRKPSMKKRQNPPVSITPLRETNDLLIKGSTSVSPSHSPLIWPLNTGSPLRSPPISPPRLPCEGLGENRALGLDERECVSDIGVDANTVLWVVLKVFLVVVLALGTKRLTVGITISAFLLFFLEYVGKHVRFVSKSSLDGEGVLKSRVNEVVKLDEKVLNGSSYEDHEIQVVESDRYPGIEIQPENEIIGVPCNQMRLGYQEIESDEIIGSSACEVAELKRKSRKSKIKSKMKKLVLKNLRSSRKGPSPQTAKIVEEEEANSVWLCDERVVQHVDGRELDNFSSELPSVLSRRCKEDDDKMSVVHSDMDEKSEEIESESNERYLVLRRCKEDDKMSAIHSEMDEKIEEIESESNWRFLVLIFIVLAGLISGRGFAILLTLSWFSILKFGEKSPRHMKVPMIKPSNQCF